MTGGDTSDKLARQLDRTPTWAVAAVCAVIIIISIALEKILHKLGAWFTKKHKKALFEALDKLQRIKDMPREVKVKVKKKIGGGFYGMTTGHYLSLTTNLPAKRKRGWFSILQIKSENMRLHPYADFHKVLYIEDNVLK